MVFRHCGLHEDDHAEDQPDVEKGRCSGDERMQESPEIIGTREQLECLEHSGEPKKAEDLCSEESADVARTAGAGGQ